ncbi:PEP-CTERM sorting domain-containing protein [Algisphaera agarilytica]|uniref:Ice-binding protein C-terminal domain-containing protein n=1 Tax=Algisphaera agarilytica TaxID=1385975 RepID=A0A7X0H747_9BACT|nr:PEP-CTERM sorting domain-containing protein [Algisphaera agarilytica]MBB6430512.1 hypothetical protein [Algisphaera agarilytica]
MAGAFPIVAGNVTLDAQDRETSVLIQARTGPADNVDVTNAAPGFGLFDDTIDEGLVIGDPPPQVSNAFAAQTSSQGVDGPDFVFDAAGNVSYDSVETFTLTFADSEYAVTFTVDMSTNYSLTGTGTYIDGAGGAGGYRVALLKGTETFSPDPMDTVFTSFGFADQGPDFDGLVEVVPFADAGTLDPGTYTIVGDAGVSGGINAGNPVTGSYDFELRLFDTVPEPTTGLVLAGLVVAMAGRRRGALVGAV